MKLDNAIKDDLKEIITKHTFPGGSASAAQSLITQKGAINLDDDGVILLHKAVRKVMEQRPSIREKFSEKYVEDKLLNFVLCCFCAPPTNLDNKLLKETAKLLGKWHRTTETWIFFVPVVNLGFLGIKKLSIGEVDFYDLNFKTFKYLESKFKVRLGHKRSLKERHSQLTKGNVSVSAVVKTTAGEIQKAQEKALTKVESSLDVLRIYDFTRNIGIQREFFAAFGHEDIYHLNITTGVRGSGHKSPLPDLFYRLDLDKNKLALMRKGGWFSRFSRLLRGQPSTKLKLKILRAIHWYGLGVKDKREIDRFVKLIVALESLLLRKKDRLKKHLLAERAAFILGKDKKEREEIYQIVDRLYSIRSEIVHEGKDEFTETDTLTLVHLVRNLIFALISLPKRIQSLEDIDNRIREIKFGSQLRGI